MTGSEDVVRASHAIPERGVVPFPGEMQDGRPDRPERLHRPLVQRPRAGPSAGDQEDGAVDRKPELLARALPRPRLRRARQGPADHSVLRARPSSDLVGEEDPSREGRRKAVREPEMRVGLRQRRGHALRPRCEHHRAGHESPGAENDIRPAPREDAPARERSHCRLSERPQQREARPAWETRNAERVELVAGGGDELRLSSLRRPRERDVDAAFPQRVRHREGRQHVSGRPAGRDQAPKLRRVHSQPHSRGCRPTRVAPRGSSRRRRRAAAGSR